LLAVIQENTTMIYLLAVLAVYRIARITAMEEGPGGIFDKVRQSIDPQQTTWKGRGLNCPLCQGVYVAFLATWFLPVHSIGEFMLTWFGIAGAQTLLHLWVEK
jgi:hypothetical protein